MNQDHKVFKLASILLQYPALDLQEYLKELEDEISEIGDPVIQTCFNKFYDYIRANSYEDVCQSYVSTFDFHERTTLYLTYGVFKDNRERGPALVRLRQEFLNAGAELESEELPDYLPLILEFAAITAIEKSAKILRLHLRSIDRLALELEAMNSPFSNIVKAAVITIKKQLLSDSLVQQEIERGIS